MKISMSTVVSGGVYRWEGRLAGGWGRGGKATQESGWANQ